MEGQLELLTGVLSLILVLLAIAVVMWGMRRMPHQRGGNSSAISVLAVQSLGTRERLVLAEVGGKQLLLGVTAQQINHLHTLEQPLDLKAQPAGFAQALQRVMEKKS